MSPPNLFKKRQFFWKASGKSPKERLQMYRFIFPWHFFTVSSHNVLLTHKPWFISTSEALSERKIENLTIILDRQSLTFAYEHLLNKENINENTLNGDISPLKYSYNLN